MTSRRQGQRRSTELMRQKPRRAVTASGGGEAAWSDSQPDRDSARNRVFESGSISEKTREHRAIATGQSPGLRLNGRSRCAIAKAVFPDAGCCQVYITRGDAHI